MAVLPQLTIYLGDDVNQLMQVQANGLPVNLTGAEDILIEFQNDPSAESAKYVASKLGGQIVVASATLGTFNLILPANKTIDFLAPQESVNMDIVVRDSSSKTKTYPVAMGLNVYERFP